MQTKPKNLVLLLIIYIIKKHLLKIFNLLGVTRNIFTANQVFVINQKINQNHQQ